MVPAIEQQSVPRVGEGFSCRALCGARVLRERSRRCSGCVCLKMAASRFRSWCTRLRLTLFRLRGWVSLRSRRAARSVDLRRSCRSCGSDGITGSVTAAHCIGTGDR